MAIDHNGKRKKIKRPKKGRTLEAKVSKAQNPKGQKIKVKKS